MKLNKLEKMYGIDFGAKDVKTVQEYLRKIGYKSLADILDGIKKRKQK